MKTQRSEQQAHLLLVAELHEDGQQVSAILFLVVFSFTFVLVLKAASATPTIASSATTPVPIRPIVHEL